MGDFGFNRPKAISGLATIHPAGRRPDPGGVSIARRRLVVLRLLTVVAVAPVAAAFQSPEGD